MGLGASRSSPVGACRSLSRALTRPGEAPTPRTRTAPGGAASRTPSIGKLDEARPYPTRTDVVRRPSDNLALYPLRGGTEIGKHDVSLHALSEAWARSRASGGTLLVMLAVADVANSNALAWPSEQTLAAKARMSERNARRALAELVELQELEMWEWAPQRGGRRNAYRVVLGDLDAWRGVPPDEILDKARKGTVRRKLAASVRTKIMTRDGYRCVFCGSTESLVIDHVHPVSLGGGDEVENLQTACRSCNAKKGNRTDWPVATGRERPDQPDADGRSKELGPVRGPVSKTLPVGADAPPRIELVNGRHPIIDAVARATGVKDGSPRLREVAIAVNGSRTQAGIVAQEWARMGPDQRARAREDVKPWIVYLVTRVGQQARIYTSKLPGAELTPGALAKWWTDHSPPVRIVAAMEVCPECEIGGGHHAADCPRAA